MQNIRRDLNLRSGEVDTIIKFLEYVETDFSKPQKFSGDITTVRTSIKAGIVLMLYNAVESTVKKCLEWIHEILISQNLMFDGCNKKIKELVVTYYEKVKDKVSDIHNKVPYILQFYDYITLNHSFELSFEDLSKFYSLYSGNLDSKEIISVLGKYDIEFEEKASELKTIKESRNKLVHGEQTFEEAGRDLSIQQLKQMIEKTFDYMRKMIDVIEKYITDKKYKA